MIKFFFFQLDGSGTSDESFLNESNVSCSPDFYLENSTCFPVCEEWRQYSDGETALTKAFVSLALVIALLGCVAVIVASFIRYKSM